MPTRNAEAIWRGDLRNGNGRLRLGSGAFEGAYSFRTRFEEEPGTNPEELIGAAHAGCFTMAFAKQVTDAGFSPERIQTSAKVKLEQMASGFAITEIDLRMQAHVPGIDQSTFSRLAEEARIGCPVSKALAGVMVRLEAELQSA